MNIHPPINTLVMPLVGSFPHGRVVECLARVGGLISRLVGVLLGFGISVCGFGGGGGNVDEGHCQHLLVS